MKRFPVFFLFLFGLLAMTSSRGFAANDLSDFSPKDRLNYYQELGADPWSYVGTTGEQVQRSDIGGEEIRYNLKYFGAFNSTINEIWRTNVADAIAFPLIKVHDGHTAQTVV